MSKSEFPGVKEELCHSMLIRVSGYESSILDIAKLAEGQYGHWRPVKSSTKTFWKDLELLLVISSKFDIKISILLRPCPKVSDIAKMSTICFI